MFDVLMQGSYAVCKKKKKKKINPVFWDSKVHQCGHLHDSDDTSDLLSTSKFITRVYLIV